MAAGVDCRLFSFLFASTWPKSRAREREEQMVATTSLTTCTDGAQLESTLQASLTFCATSPDLAGESEDLGKSAAANFDVCRL